MIMCVPSACPPGPPSTRVLPGPRGPTPKAGAPTATPAQGALREEGGSGDTGKEEGLVDFGALGRARLTSGLARHCRLVVWW